MNRFDAILLIAFGGPENPDEIRPFLERVTEGRGIPPARLEEVARHYEQIGGGAPRRRAWRRGRAPASRSAGARR